MMEMRYIAKDIPLWQVTIWDKKFNNVDKKWQPKTIKYKYLLSDELDSLRVDDGDVRILYTGKDVGFTTEELAGDRLSEGEIISIPWGGIPTVKYHKGKFVTGDNRIATSKDIDKLTNKYLYYFMRGNIHEIASYYRGASLKHPCMKDILKMTISYPSVQEQDKICGQFDVLEQIIEVRKQELQLLDDLIKARFVEMFNLSDCIYKSLGECTDFVDYRGHTPELSDEGIIRMVNAKSVGKGFFKYVDEFVTEETYDAWMHRGFGYPGDILFVTEGHTFGNTCLIPEDMTKFALGQRVITIKGKEEIKNAFLCSYMQTDMFWKDINVYRTGGTAQGIRSKDLVKVMVPIPPIEQQIEFVRFVHKFDKSKVAVQKALDETQMLFDSLMQKYFG